MIWNIKILRHFKRAHGRGVPLKIAVIHLSDFHTRDGQRYSKQKMDRFLDSINTLGNIGKFIVVLSGDYACNGAVNEYKVARRITNAIIFGLKEKCENEFVELLIVPGNHDMVLSNDSRKWEDIQSYYNNSDIERHIPEELKRLDNFYVAIGEKNRKLLSMKTIRIGEFSIQFNLINTTLFSTLDPDDKEFHYFPQSELSRLKVSSSADVCITVMHHSFEFFHWSCKSALERAVTDCSHMILWGHDHEGHAKIFSIDDSSETWISCAGEMKFSTIDPKESNDSFNAIVIDTAERTFICSKFEWDSKERLFRHHSFEKKGIEPKINKIRPAIQTICEYKIDEIARQGDFTKYFVFPKMTSVQEGEFGKHENIQTIDALLECLKEKKRIHISGSSNSGKTTLSRYIYCQVAEKQKEMMPLLITVDSTTKLKPKNFVRHCFEEQYGEDPVLFERYQQCPKDHRLLIVDGWDLLGEGKNLNQLQSVIHEVFGRIILITDTKHRDVVTSLQAELKGEDVYYELEIRPFFAEKREELVRNICLLENTSDEEDIDQVNKLVNSLVKNNPHMFSLTPDFIIKYTRFFLNNSQRDYANGEAVFSKVFEHELEAAIITFSKRTNVDEIMWSLEEIAGCMFRQRQDVLSITTFQGVIEDYRKDYGVKIESKEVLETGLRSKVLSQSEELGVYFSNKNYLAYFVAKNLLRAANSDGDISGIQYALNNICFRINADIILFLSYLSSSTQYVMLIQKHAGELLSEFDELDLEKNNTPFLRRLKAKEVNAPSKAEQDETKKQREQLEEVQYDGENVEARGLFSYNEADADEMPNKMLRAIKYCEMLCTALPAFNSSLKLSQKQELVKAIYSYPSKIIFALLKPIDDAFDELCDKLFQIAKDSNAKKKNGQVYTINDIQEMLVEYGNGAVLGTYDHFAELCTSPKSIDLLCECDIDGINRRLLRLLVIENSGNTDLLIKEADHVIKAYKDDDFRYLVCIIMRKHLLFNTRLSSSRKQRIADKFFPAAMRKELLMPTSEKK